MLRHVRGAGETFLDYLLRALVVRHGTGWERGSWNLLRSQWRAKKAFFLFFLKEFWAKPEKSKKLVWICQKAEQVSWVTTCEMCFERLISKKRKEKKKSHVTQSQCGKEFPFFLKEQKCGLGGEFTCWWDWHSFSVNNIFPPRAARDGMSDPFPLVEPRQCISNKDCGITGSQAQVVRPGLLYLSGGAPREDHHLPLK